MSADPVTPIPLPYAHGEPPLQGRMRARPEDFQVIEALDFALAGEGEHVWLWVQKRGANTAWAAERLARLAGVKAQDVGFSGLKDRHAVTRQWFSVYLPKGAEPDWTALNDDELQVLDVQRHRQKLRRGMHAANHFTITLRELAVSGDWQARWAAISQHGVPNYFGEQRFGRDGGNLAGFAALVAGERPRKRALRGLYLSAGRSELFNRVLAARVRAGTWAQCLPGEALVDGGPSGPLWGRGRSGAQVAALAVEQSALGAVPDWLDFLEHAGLKQERRPLVLRALAGAAALNGQAGPSEPASFSEPVWEDDTLTLSFTLPTGTFATVFLRELVAASVI